MQMFGAIRQFVELRSTMLALSKEDRAAIKLHVPDAGYDGNNPNTESTNNEGGDYYDSF